MRPLFLAIISTLVLQFSPAAQAINCGAYFKKIKTGTALMVLEQAKTVDDAQASILGDLTIQVQATAFVNRMPHLNLIQKLEKRRNFYQGASGNSTKSRVDQFRQQRGERFYRLLRSGDRRTALKMARQVFSPVIVAARVIDRANGFIEVLEYEIANLNLSKSQLKESRKLVKQLKAVITEQSKNFGGYGNVRMLAWQMQRYVNKISQMTHGAQIMSEIAVDVRNMSKEFDSQADLQISQRIEKDAHERVEYVARKVGVSSFETIFPELFKHSDYRNISSKADLLELVWAEANYAKFVMDGKRVMTESGLAVYGSHLPLRAVIKREATFEAIDAAKNIIGSVLSDVGSLFRSINSSRFEATLKKNDPKAWKIVKAYNKTTWAVRETLYYFLKGLSELQSLEVHAPKIDLVEDMLSRYQEKLETREDFTTTLMSISGSFRGNEFFISFARIPEYRRTFRQTIEILKEEVEAVKKEFGNRDNLTSKEERLLEKLYAAEKIAAQKDVGDLPLVYEPNFVKNASRYTGFVGGPLVLYGGYRATKSFVMQPEVLEALSKLFPGMF